MNSYISPPSDPPPPSTYPLHGGESLRLEGLTACVGFDDLLDITLHENHQHLDTMIVVTSHEDRKTQLVCKKYGVICVETDLFKKNGRNFNKGAALNAGMARWQYHGWRLHIDSDMILPDNFRRILFNHTHLDDNAIYGCDRIDVIGLDEWNKIKSGTQQHSYNFNLRAPGMQPISHRYVDPLRGYVPIGAFQLWNCKCEKPYPWSLGTAAHDDVAFADQWPAGYRRHLPTVICYHLCGKKPTVSENWDGFRKQPRLDEGKKGVK